MIFIDSFIFCVTRTSFFFLDVLLNVNIYSSNIYLAFGLRCLECVCDKSKSTKVTQQLGLFKRDTFMDIIRHGMGFLVIDHINLQYQKWHIYLYIVQQYINNYDSWEEQMSTVNNRIPNESIIGNNCNKLVVFNFKTCDLWLREPIYLSVFKYCVWASSLQLLKVRTSRSQECPLSRYPSTGHPNHQYPQRLHDRH